jgi:aryl-phospho-beta-D-glucosidase BglC (GH1 family)
MEVKHKDAFSSNAVSSFPPLLKADGNKISDSSGNPVIFKGIMPPDPRVLFSRYKFKKEFFQEIKNTGANVIRIPVHPNYYREDKDYLWRYLDPIVAWAGEMNMYVIIDCHYIGNIQDGSGDQMPEIDIHPKEFTKEFWTLTANYFKDVPNVIFEIYNEPAQITPDVWADNANEIVKYIRDAGAEQLIIVGGVEYSKDLSWVLENPIADDNIAYASHIYPSHSQSQWPSYFGDVSEKYPVLITEWGFIDEQRNSTKQNYLIGDENSFGKPFIEYLNQKNIGWVACWYDDTWEPQMFKADFKGYTNYGSFVIDLLKE